MRIVAFLMLLLPGILGVYGIKLIRDSFFGIVESVFLNVFVQLFAGVLFVIIGIGFIGGFLLHRDRRKQKTK
ncbi:DUF2627 family protein [Piscibacillus sp. B03]|uniref:DUF2627 family protein n=1 Tax=Piscibacillus sp. B03 TaxID=3457430 RepID=UPI003FCCC86C